MSLKITMKSGRLLSTTRSADFDATVQTYVTRSPGAVDDGSGASIDAAASLVNVSRRELRSAFLRQCATHGRVQHCFTLSVIVLGDAALSPIELQFEELFFELFH